MFCAERGCTFVIRPAPSLRHDRIKTSVPPPVIARSHPGDAGEKREKDEKKTVG
jgi:hypothetical protein